MGAWIETGMMIPENTAYTVAPFMGAWIETYHKILKMHSVNTSLPSWERGLKLT